MDDYCNYCGDEAEALAQTKSVMTVCEFCVNLGECSFDDLRP